MIPHHAWTLVSRDFTLVLDSSTDWLLLCIDVYQTFLTNFGALYLSEFLMDLAQILDYKSYDQA